MRSLLVYFFCILCLWTGALAELSASSCSILRTATSLATIAPEVAHLAMRYYGASSSTVEPDDAHHREKRFLFNDQTSHDAIITKASVLEQVAANAFKDVDFTKVALLILNNNETMSKLRQNIDSEPIVRAIMRGIDYEKLGDTLWRSARAEFDVEQFIAGVVNVTRLDQIQQSLIVNGTLPDWFLEGIHPDIDVQRVHQMFATLKNFTAKFVRLLSNSQRLDEFLFTMIQQQALMPMTNIVQRIKDAKPTTLDQLIEATLNNVNKAISVRIRVDSGRRHSPSLRRSLRLGTIHNHGFAIQHEENTKSLVEE